MAAQPELQASALRSLIARELQRVAVEHGRTLLPLTDGIKLVESGLDSLSADSPVTFGEFVCMYESLGD
jgi:hypothetical protein